MSRIRERTGNQESIIHNYIKKRGRKEEKGTAEKVEEEILEKFNKEKRVIRSPPNKIKREERKEKSMETEKMLKEILTKMDEQERERKRYTKNNERDTLPEGAIWKERKGNAKNEFRK